MLKRLYIPILIALYCWPLAVDTGAAPSPEVPVMRSVVCALPPVVDGKLDDACWEQADQATGFLRSDTAEPIADRTEILICYDQEALYVAFHCYDREPDQIRAMEKKRGGKIWQDDLVEIALDTYHAHEETYWFSLTAGGTQHDYFPGGSSENVGWRGDWQGAATVGETEWTAELAIPWSILRYPKDTTVIGFGATRHVPREDVWVNWPDLGSDWDARRMADLADLQLPDVRHPPVILPHILGGAQQDESRDISIGLDIKQLFSSGLTGTFTYNPDFKTIEDEIESIDFSYTERWVSDRRPFFTEGGDYFPGSRMFYTRRIEDVDTGVKLFGRMGKAQVGILDATKFGQRNDLAGKVAYDAGEDLNIWAGAVHSTMFDSSNATAGFGANFNHTTANDGGYHIGMAMNRTVAGHTRGNAWSANFSKWPGGKGGFDLWSSIQNIDDTYTSWTGYVPERNFWKVGVYPGFWRRFEKKSVRDVSAGLSFFRAQSKADTLLYRGVGVRGGFGLHKLNDSGVWISLSLVERPPNIDKTIYAGLNWNGKDIHQQGHLGASIGRKDGEKYFFLDVDQGYKLAEKFHLNLRAELRRMQEPLQKAEYRNLMVFTGNYDLTNERSIGLLLIHRRNPEDGEDVLRKRLVNVCFTYHQSVRSGTDIFLVLGDPNEDEIQKRVAFKLVRPLFGN